MNTVIFVHNIWEPAMLCYIRTQSLLNMLMGGAMMLSAVRTEASVEDVEE